LSIFKEKILYIQTKHKSELKYTNLKVDILEKMFLSYIKKLYKKLMRNNGSQGISRSINLA